MYHIISCRAVMCMSRAPIRPLTRTHMHTQTHTQRLTYIRKHTHTHIHTHTHTHTHAHTQVVAAVVALLNDERLAAGKTPYVPRVSLCMEYAPYFSLYVPLYVRGSSSLAKLIASWRRQDALCPTCVLVH